MENFNFLCSVLEICDVTMDYYYYFIITLFPGIKIRDSDDDTDDNEWEEEEVKLQIFPVFRFVHLNYLL